MGKISFYNTTYDTLLNLDRGLTNKVVAEKYNVLLYSDRGLTNKAVAEKYNAKLDLHRGHTNKVVAEKFDLLLEGLQIQQSQKNSIHCLI